jgi:hypothetical protein
MIDFIFPILFALSVIVLVILISKRNKKKAKCNKKVDDFTKNWERAQKECAAEESLKSRSIVKKIEVAEYRDRTPKSQTVSRYHEEPPSRPIPLHEPDFLNVAHTMSMMNGQDVIGRNPEEEQLRVTEDWLRDEPVQNQEPAYEPPSPSYEPSYSESPSSYDSSVMDNGVSSYD